MPRKRRSLGVFSDLVKAVDWYDNSLQSILKSKHMTSVNRTQSLMLVHIAVGFTRPSDITREMGTTRQNIHAMAKDLLKKNIIVLIPDPVDGRSKQYVFADDAIELRDTVIRILNYLDRKLAERIGKDSVKALKTALSTDWGGHIVDFSSKPP